MTNKLPIEVNEALGQMNESQLRELNRRVVERIKLYGRAKTINAMGGFNLGDKVAFNHGMDIVEGSVIRLNQKTLTIIDGFGYEWRVSPQLVSKF